MKSLFRPIALLAVALPLALGACGSKEPEQRAAFAQFLKTRIVDKPGIHVPQPTNEETESFGDYASHYQVITDFHAGMDASVKPLGGMMQKTSMRSLGDIMGRRDELKTVQSALGEMGAALKEERSKADAARAKLQQPDDLKTVYDQAYEKTVTLPADTFADVLPQLSATLDASLNVADYVSAHQAQIDVSGPVVKVSDPAVQQQLNQLLQDLNAQARNMQQAQTRLQAVMIGR
ncbi:MULTISPECIES: DUF3053 family protein [unclassified Achromobacter]|uniref:DUF3053 family protein n=1 Tax=unclassified Achromobacter TaxID=2626865 RepID=UPI00069D8740|nr:MULTISPECIES: DUF3053 family protein [unclassified Achromobacter]KOF55127.1 hypothetical protein AD428_02815 [Achromobacter sp. DMS1]